MPKEVSERIIDSPFAPATRVGNVSIGTGGGGGGGGATNFDALTDVTITAPVNGQVPTYNSGSGQWVNAAPAAMTAHALSGSFHTGTLNWSLVNTAGSNLTDISTRLHSDLQGMTPNDHHAQQHLLATGTALGADHTISGAAVGEVLRALSATTAAFDVLQHTDLGNILPDQHHPFVHDIITGAPTFGVAHTVTGADYTVVGVHPANTLAILPTSSAPGAAISVLRTDADGGIQLDTNLLYVDGANNRVGINKVPTDAGFGSAALDIIASNNADHTQRIRQKAGQTGRLWRVENTAFHELIVMDSDGSLMSGNPLFVSGLAGWNITPEGNAEFNNIWARGELHATVFVKDEVHATGGTFMVATAGTLHDDAVISSSTVDDDTLVVYSTPAGQGVPLQVVTTSGTFVGNELHVSWIGNFINVNDPPSGPGTIGGPGPYFQPGDIIRSKTEVATGVTDFWFEVINSVQTSSGYATYSVYKRSGTDGTLPKGAALVSYGKEGDGRILMTSDLQFAPYIDVFTTGTNVWLGAAGSVKERMRMGRLDGIKVPGVQGIEQYGMIAGKDLTDASQGYLIASNLQFSLYKVDIRLNNGSNDTGLWTADGNLKIGSNVGATATTGFSVFTTGGRAGDVVIGNEATGNFLRWQQATGVLTVTGSLIVSDPGTTVTKTYVDNQDAAYDVAAQGYGSTAQTNSIAYGDARRIVGVTGTWPSAANQISWSGLSVVFANGSSRSIANGNTTTALGGVMAARTYLYVNMSGAGTLTMVATTSASAVGASVNNVLIAVCDPGPAKASVSVVAGSTYISGSNIFTESIYAGHIAVGSITADRLDASTLTVTYLDPVTAAAATDATTKDNAVKVVAANDATTKANTAEQNAKDAAALDATAKADANKTYSDARRILAVGGSFTGVNGNTVSWGTPTALQARFANGGTRTITAQTNVTLSPAGRWYFYVDVSGSGTMAMETPTRFLADLGVNHVLIAVVDTSTLGPTPVASINIVAGSTYISGGNIMTGSIVAGNIASSTISADRMNIDYLGGMSSGIVRTGILEMDNASNIHSAGKTAYNNGTAGIFLGWDLTATATYRFGIGDSTNYLQWNGSNLVLRMAQGIDILATSSNLMRVTNAANTDIARIFYFNSQFQFDHDLLAPNLVFVNPGGGVELSASNIPGSLFCPSPFLSGTSISAPILLSSGGRVRMTMASSTPTSSGGAPSGTIGDLMWGGGTGPAGSEYLYLYTSSGWKRVLLSTLK